MERKALCCTPKKSVGEEVLDSKHEVWGLFWISVHMLSVYYGEDRLQPLH